MVVFAGQGDARRSMNLLWRVADERTGPGPKPGLTLDRIVDAAIEVADADGMAGLSMRAVGGRLGRTAMALYTYLPNKAELIDLMYDRVLGELPVSYDAESGWRVAVTAWAHDHWEFYLRHPWVLQVSQARPVLGPNEFARVETLLAVLHPAGLRSRVLRGVVGALVDFVRGAARTIAEAREATAATGVSENDWWYARSPLLAEVAPDFTERFPLVSLLEGEGAFDFTDETSSYLEQEAEETFEVGLAVLLDGIEAQRSV